MTDNISDTNFGNKVQVRACFTGHRPSKINKYDKSWIAEQLKDAIQKLHTLHGVEWFISGGAIGIDQTAAKIVEELRDKEDFPIKIAIFEPFNGFTERWVDVDYMDYQDIRAKADLVKCLTNEPYNPAHYFNRNQAMVDEAEWIIAVWDGSKGGTEHTLTYAKNKKKILINPRTKEVHIRE